MDDDILFAVLVSDVARMLRTELDRRARGEGLTRSQWLALSRLARFPGVPTISICHDRGAQHGQPPIFSRA